MIDTKKIYLTITPEMEERLNHIAERQGTPRSAVIRQILTGVLFRE